MFPSSLVLASLLLAGSTAVVSSILEDVQPLAEPSLSIGAFNVRVLGTTKIKSKEVVDVIVKVIRRYDIILIQEVRDSKGVVIPTILTEVNNGGAHQYNVTYSERLGRTASKEQYAFFYRVDSVTITDTYQYMDPTDCFQREPFSVKVQTTLPYVTDRASTVSEFAIVGLHADPHEAIEELSCMPDVVLALQVQWGLENTIITGDLNAGCDYASTRELANLTLWKDPRYESLIDYSVDTTTTHTYCSYDRFILMGKSIQQAVVPNSVKIFPFDEEYLLNGDQTLAVSDHYPIEFQLTGLPNSLLQSGATLFHSFSVQDEIPVGNINSLRALYRSKDPAPFIVEQLLIGTRISYVTASVSDISDPIAVLGMFREKFPGVLSDNAVSMVVAVFDAEILQSGVYVYGLAHRSVSPGQFSVTIFCTFKGENKCRVSVQAKMTD